MLSAADTLALALDPALILRAQGIDADPWQRQFLLSPSPRLLLLCSRGAGKSRATSALALHTALFQPGSLTLLISRAQRQSLELFRYVKQGFNAVGRPIEATKENETTLELANGSRVVALPGKEGTIRSFQGVQLLILDEAARVPDDLYYTIRPMLGVSRGRLVALTTPFGRRGWFHQEYEHGGDQWDRIRIPWHECPRLTPEFIAQERASLGESWVQQEYECLFTAMEGLVYPDFESCVWDCLGFARGALVGGIDFGWRNPFAAVWGAVDKDDVLWLIGERYERQTPLHEHRAALKALGPMMWYADPAGATEIAELRAADLKVRRGTNDIRLGIAAVTARIQSGRLRVSRTGCPNLIAEARLYRYPSQAERRLVGENPIGENNHALAALRYLVSRIDHRFIARLKRQRGPLAGAEGGPPEGGPGHLPADEEVARATAQEAKRAERERIEETQKSIWNSEIWNDPEAWS